MSQWGPTGQSTPNYNAEADGMASIISHELTEAVTDPELNAWCARAPSACTVILRWPQLELMEVVRIPRDRATLRSRTRVPS